MTAPTHTLYLGEKKDYSANYADWLTGGESIALSTFTVTPSGGLTEVQTGIAAGITTVWYSGGTEDITYKVVNYIETNSTPARQKKFVFYITVRNILGP